MRDYSEIVACRLCQNKELLPVMSIGDIALTGVFPKSIAEVVPSGPVDLVKCNEQFGCGLVQLKQSYSLEAMYGMNYGYRSGLNLSMVEHLHKKVHQILALEILQPGDLILDIGSNDSTTLRAYPKDLYNLVGIDPTGIKFSTYYPAEIKLIPKFFSANEVLSATDGLKAKVITSFSMFFDLEDPLGFAKEIEACLHDDGVWVLEQSYLPAMIHSNSFDTICHEHLEFYSLRQIVWICERAGLKVLNVEFNDVNGGSFSITTSKATSTFQVNAEVIEQVMADESALGISKISAFDLFRERVEQCRYDLVSFIMKAKIEGKSVYAHGASTKGNVLLQYFQLDANSIHAVGEVNPDKFGAFTPGTLIPIVSEEELLSKNPDYIIVLPWHFRSFFIASKKLKGCKLVFPLPKLEMVQL